MLFNEHAISYLSSNSSSPETGRSSYWIDALNGFRRDDNRFVGKALPEGQGSSRRSILQRVVHYIFQTPFRVMGVKFGHFRRLLRSGYEIHKRRGNELLLGTLRQIISLSAILSSVPESIFSHPSVIVGDGFGVMGSLIYSLEKSGKIVEVNLTPNLLIDAQYLLVSHPGICVALPSTAEEYIEALNRPEIDVLLVQADNSRYISRGKIGLAINIVSMQEMNPEIIDSYFSHFRKSQGPDTYFYCCNREEKTLPDATVVRFNEYPWRVDDDALFDGLCPWSQYHYRFHPPFYFPYGGPIRHRLVKLAKLIGMEQTV